MRLSIIHTALAFLSLCGIGAAGDLVREDRIKVFLFAAPAFWQEVAVDAYNRMCVNLDNNLIDGMVQSILIGGHDVQSVMQRTDGWSCTFYDNYDCIGDETNMLTFSDGVNNLRSVDWQSKLHALKCKCEYWDSDSYR